MFLQYATDGGSDLQRSTPLCPVIAHRRRARLEPERPDGLTIVDLVASDDTVWIRNLARGVDTGGVLGRPPTGLSFEITVFDVLRFADGRLIEHWGVPDQLGLLLQLKLFGRPEAAAVA
jgi:predicted ester cyclase